MAIQNCLDNRVLYKEHQTKFISDVERNLVTPKMRNTADSLGINVKNEIASWENNAPHIARLLTQCGAKDSYVTFEFLVPFLINCFRSFKSFVHSLCNDSSSLKTFPINKVKKAETVTKHKILFNILNILFALF